MTIRFFLEKIVVFLLFISLFLIFTTSVAAITQSQDWNRVFGVNLHMIIELFDLREEKTIATWFSSCVFLLTGMGFCLLGWGKSIHYTMSCQGRFLFKLVAFGAVLLSADEVASVHEKVGVLAGRSLYGNESGFIWVLIFSPVLLGGFIATVYFLRKLIANMTNRNLQRKAMIALYAAFLCLPTVLLLEGLEWYLNTINMGFSLSVILEESFEILGMLCMLVSVLLIARSYEL